MLAYLDSLIAALNVRNASEIDRLLTHPLIRILPPDARLEVEAIRDGACDGSSAPLRVMRLRHQTAELLRASAVAERGPEYVAPRVQISRQARVRNVMQAQMELPLSA